ncbi:MAG: cupredoxin domain-containing protein [Gammaproteobacteria bacterium]|nr:cupredoxin domain-containing protein [Gammaproteobacteria bacterium]
MKTAAISSRWWGLALVSCALGIGVSCVVRVDEPIVRITAKKFEYTPHRITVKKGQAVTLELTSLDRVHGFNLPAFGLRGEIVPGKPLRVNVTPTKSGEFPFFCDIFCGLGHEEMSALLIVTD